MTRGQDPKIPRTGEVARDIAFTWLRAEDYSRFVELFGPDVHASHADFLAVSIPRAWALEQHGLNVVRILVDPDDMARWCLDQKGHLGPDARAAYAAFSAGMQDTVPEGEA